MSEDMKNGTGRWDDPVFIDITDEEAAAYEEWLENTPEVEATTGTAPVYELGTDPHKKSK